MSRLRTLLVVTVVIGALAAAVARPSPAGAQPVKARAVAVDALLIGDSVMAGMALDYGAEGRAVLAARHSFVLDAVTCRRLIAPSCRIGSTPAPTNTLTVLAERTGQFNRALVIGAGYNDSSTGSLGIGAAVDRLVAEARQQGVTRVVWLTYREAGSSSHVALYRADNEILRAKAAEHPDLYLADWAERSRSFPSSWFSADGLHLGGDAATEMGDLIADTLDVALRGAPPPPPPPPTTLPPPTTAPAPRPTIPAPPPTTVPVAPPPPTRCTSTVRSGSLPPALPPAIDTAPAGGVHVMAPPVRLLDTRDLPGKLGARRLIEVPVAGTNGVPVDASAAIVSIATVEPCAAGFVAAFPCGSGVPTTAVLNAPSGAIVANSAVVRLGAGAMCVYANEPTDVVVDLTGWIGPGGASTNVLSPLRLVDTRSGEQQALPIEQRRLAAGQVLSVDIAAHPSVGHDATAVTLNLAAADPAAAGFLTVLPGPCAAVALPPTTATLTVTADRDVAASATVATGGGQICVYSSVDTGVVIDLQSAHGPNVPDGRMVTTISPQRLVDTRPAARLAAGTVLPLDLDALMQGVPAGLSGAVLNLAAVDPAANGYLVVYGCSLAQTPFVSNLNVASRTVANRVLVSTEGGRELCVFSTVATDVVIDVEGWVV